MRFALVSSVLVPLLYTLTEATGIGIHVRRKSGLVPLVSLAALATALPLLYALIPPYGARGAAAAAAMAFWIFCMLKSELSARLWQPLPRRTFYPSTLAALAAAVLHSLFGSARNYPLFAVLWTVGLLWAAWLVRDDLGRLKKAV